MPKGMRVQVPPRAPNLHRANNFAAPLFSQFKLLKKKDLAELPPLLEKSTNPLLQRDSIPLDGTPAEKWGPAGKWKRREKGKRQHRLCVVWTNHEFREFDQPGAGHLQCLSVMQANAAPQSRVDRVTLLAR